MSGFSRNMLPLLGVSYRRFPTRSEAERFASWAEHETRNDQYPCEAFVYFDDRGAEVDSWEVKVVNW